MSSQEVKIAKIEENQKTMNEKLDEIRDEFREGLADIKSTLSQSYVRKDVYSLEMNTIKTQLKNSKGVWDYVWKTAVGAVIGVLVTIIFTKGF